MSTPAPIPAPGEQVPALSQAERVIDTFIAPSKTFTDIRHNASWWLPWLLGAIIGGAMVYTVDKKVGMEKVVENQIQLSPKAAARMDQLPADQRQAQIDTQTKITRDFSYGFSLVSLVVLAVVAAVLLATFKFGLGAELTFWQAFAISNYAWLPGCIKALLVILTVSLSGGENFTFQNPLASNLGALFDPNGSHFLYSVASAIDVFSIWILVLTGIGYSCVTRVKRGTCMGVVFGWWAVVTLVGAALGSLFS
jgi:Yip1 domain